MTPGGRDAPVSSSDEPIFPGSSCIHCHEPIRPGASRCPHCLAWQSRWGGDSQHPRLELLFLIGGAALVAAIFGWLYATSQGSGHGRAGERQRPILETVDVRCFPYPVDIVDRRPESLAVVGTIRNGSDTDFRDPYLSVACFDAGGTKVDAFPARVTGLVIPAHSQAEFKVFEFRPLAPIADYDECTVEVRWAQSAE